MARFGIVVLNYQKYEMTESCVLSLINKNIDAKILIVDNASPNESFSYLTRAFDKYDQVEVIKNDQNAGYARGNNFGFKYLFEKYKELEFCCVMNPDVEIRDGVIFDHLMDKLDLDSRYAMATGLMITNGRLNMNSCFWSIPKGREVATGHCVLHKNQNGPLNCDEHGVAEVEVLPGSFFMIKRSVFEELGGFDEGTFLYNEENILGAQLKKLGYTEILSIGDCYNHNHPKGERKKLAQKLKSRKIGNQSRGYLCSKFYPKYYLVLLDIVIVANVFIISVKHLAGNARIVLKGKK